MPVNGRRARSNPSRFLCFSLLREKLTNTYQVEHNVYKVRFEWPLELDCIEKVPSVVGNYYGPAQGGLMANHAPLYLRLAAIEVVLCVNVMHVRFVVYVF